MDNSKLTLHFEEEYIWIIDTFKPEDFQERALESVMRHKLYRANKPLQGHQLKKKFREIRAQIHSEWIPLLPMNISQIASGNQLWDTYKKMIIKTYLQSNVSTYLLSWFHLYNSISSTIHENTHFQ
jgi:hypothetical protein